MKNSGLFKRAGALGFPLLSPEESQDPNLTLADLSKSKDLRLWEGFPVVLANTAERGLFNYVRAVKHLRAQSDKSCLVSLLIMSLAVYRFFNLRFSWSEELYKSFSKNQKRAFTVFLKALRDDKELKVAGKQMSAERLKAAFKNYFGQTQMKLKELLSLKDELSLEYALSQVFSPKQKELFLRKLKGEKLTKTEKEYFSRTVKKKVLALANPEMHRLAQKLLD